MKYFFLVGLATMLIAAQTSEDYIALNGGKVISFKVGHNAEDCANSGEFLDFAGELMLTHTPCQGFGHECEMHFKAEVISHDESLQNILTSGKEYEVLLYQDATLDEELVMPDRSIFSEQDGKYINIPEQILKKKTGESEYYVAIKVAFTTKAIHENK